VLVNEKFTFLLRNYLAKYEKIWYNKNAYKARDYRADFVFAFPTHYNNVKK